MSKKSRRARARARGIEPVAPVSPIANRPQPRMQTAPQTVTRQSAAPAAAAFQAKNYDYVKSDIVRIAIIAGALIVILIVLAFVPGLRS